MSLPDKSNRVYSEPIVLDYFIFYYTEVGIFSSVDVTIIWIQERDYRNAKSTITKYSLFMTCAYMK